MHDQYNNLSHFDFLIFYIIIFLLGPAEAGGANRILFAGGSLIEQYFAWEHAWDDQEPHANLQGGMLQSASCSKTVYARQVMLLDDHLSGEPHHS